MFRIVVLVLGLVAAIVGLLFGALNPDPVALDFMFLKIHPPAGAALLGMFALGLVCGMLIVWLLFYLPAGWRKKRNPKSETRNQYEARNAKHQAKESDV